MLERGKMERGTYEIVDTESLVPADHLLRKIDAAVDFNKIYDMVEPLYCADNGRPSVDPVVLFKMVLVQHLYGLPSLRRTAEEVSLNMAYRWFLGYRLQEETPHFSTVSYNFKHRFTPETVNQIFDWVLQEIAEAGYLYTHTVFVDGTHIKANANTKKVVKEEVEVEVKRYAEELMEEVNADRIAHGKKPFAEEEEETAGDNDKDPPSTPKKKRGNTSKKKLKKRKKEAKKETVTKSTTDPDAGMFVKGDHKKQMAYEAHTACNQHGYVLAVEVTPGNVHDSVAFDDVYDNLVEKYPEVKTVVADSAYKTPHICKKVFDDDRLLYTPYKRPQTMKGGHEWWKYVYDEYYDCIICPEYQTLDAQGVLSFQELPIPKYGPCQALVKLRSCGVCNGTDTKLIHGTFKNFSTYPAILGHEGVGEVVEVGEKVTNLHVGDLVLLPFLEEKVDGYTPGWGAYSEYAVVGDAQAYIVNGMGPGTKKWSEGYLAQTVIRPEDKVDVVGAAMIITFREVLSAIRRFGFKPNESVLIFGAGPVGLCFTRFCKLLGLGTVITTDISDEKVNVAKRMGADYAFNTKNCDIDAEIHKLFPDGVDNVVDAVGVNALLNQAMGLIRYNGKICGYGISPKLGMDLDWSKAPYNWSLNFVQWPSKKEEAEAHAQIMAWINAGVLDPMDFISHTFPFDQAMEAFDLVARREPGTKKIVITF